MIGSLWCVLPYGATASYPCRRNGHLMLYTLCVKGSRMNEEVPSTQAGPRRAPLGELGSSNILVFFISLNIRLLLPYALRTAPAGSSLCSRYFQNATNSFRASATIPTFLIRLLPWPKRSWYHLLNSLSGW